MSTQPIHLNSPAVAIAAESLARIRQASLAVNACLAGVQSAKQALKAAKEDHSEAVRELQRIIKEETTPLPLFDRPAQGDEE